MNAPATALPAVREQHSLKEVAIAGHGLGVHLVPQSMADVVRFAETMAKGAIAIRKHLRDNPGACLAVTLQALDWGMNPISVANKSYAVNDQLAYESQLIAAVIHARAPIKGRPRYTYTGEPTKTRQCTVEVTTLDGEVLDYTSPEVGKITTKNSPLWKSDEDQQLGYFSIRSLARRHFPELLLGVYDREEVQEVRDVIPHSGTGMRARLEARQAEVEPNGGFDPAHVEAELAGEPIADAEFEEPGAGAAESQVDAPAADDDFPGDRQDEAFDAPAWAADLNRDLDQFETAEALNAFTDDRENIAKFEALEKASPGLAKSLAAAINGRRKALADRDGGE